jgi:diguanylate cyclase (GGDEF)-like protein
MKMDRILIVDDKEENLYLLRALLHGHGYEVVSARHGAEALIKARQNPPDLVISDLLMPVMDGYTLLHNWKADERLKTIPFVVYTATFTDKQDEHLALDLGADDFILKPTEPEPFLARINEAMVKAKSGLSPVRTINTEKATLGNEYSEVLFRKLEGKAFQLEEANRVLQQEIIERKRAELELKYIGFHDPLTGLYNRGFFEEDMARLERGRQFPVSIVMMDVDGLKQTNDREGHAAGDELLRRVAYALSAAFRAEDVVARIGGDEFGVLLPNTNAAQAENAIGRVRHILQVNNEAHEGKPLSLSFGVSTAEQRAPLADVLKLADENMYREKRGHDVSKKDHEKPWA